MRCLRGLRQDSRRRMALCSSVRKDASAVTVDRQPREHPHSTEQCRDGEVDGDFRPVSSHYRIECSC